MERTGYCESVWESNNPVSTRPSSRACEAVVAVGSAVDGGHVRIAVTLGGADRSGRVQAAEVLVGGICLMARMSVAVHGILLDGAT